jgi:hypothetical protein
MTITRRDALGLPGLGSLVSVGACREQRRVSGPPSAARAAEALHYLGLGEIARRIQAREVASADLARHMLDRIARGGVQPHWGADGRELFFLSLSGSMMSVRVTPGPELMMDPPSVLFTTNIEPNANLNQYAVTPDGKRFLTLDRGEHRAHTFTFLLNALRPGMKTSR